MGRAEFGLTSGEVLAPCAVPGCASTSLRVKVSRGNFGRKWLGEAVWSGELALNYMLASWGGSDWTSVPDLGWRPQGSHGHTQRWNVACDFGHCFLTGSRYTDYEIRISESAQSRTSSCANALGTIILGQHNRRRPRLAENRDRWDPPDEMVDITVCVF